MSESEIGIGLAEAAGDSPGSLTDRAYRQLEERIVTLQMAPGEVLSEAALSKQLGIGRTPIREALQRLAREGLVVILPRRGILVAEINVRNQLELLRVRRELERLMAILCARRCTAEERTVFAELAAQMDAAASGADDVAFMRQDRQLNLLIATCCRNQYASRAMGLTHGLSRRFWYQHYKQVLDLPLCARLHAEQARAIAASDKDAAAAATDRLMDYMESFTRATLDAELGT
ncbi:GntR family transcriptional regulator [Algihabitans albus]|uniref:GntR family transcriptional regulator n=1 Tax=Algihabitans albus TaxID=2164067 RepID=UPI000E5D694A|nr:GntR family transcriptional regulator [Algihabitans albus]